MLFRSDAYTVRYSGDAPQTGIVLGTLDDGRRCLAHTEISETMFAQLLEEDCVGLRGHVTGGEAVNRFRF